MKTYHDIVTDGGSDVVGQLEEQSGRMAERLADVHHVVAVASGKGGVGKSTVAANIAMALLRSGRSVGILDGDINGPSIGRITGAREYRRGPGDAGGLVPVVVHGGLRVMSMDLFLDGENAPVVWDAPTQKNGFAWRGLREAGALRELITDTGWGVLDYLIVDLPPGADRLPNLADILPQLSGAVIITIPSAVAAAAVGKSIRMATEYLDAAVLGVIENMSAHVCPHCGSRDELFPGGSTDRLAAELGATVLGRIPFDPAIALTSDEGSSYLDEHPERPAAIALRALADRLLEALPC